MLKKEYDAKDESYFTHERHEMLRYVPQGITSMLDVGCSSGKFGDYVKKNRKCTVWGIEPDQKAAEKASLVLDRVINAFFDEKTDLSGQRFDCIIFNDVLEHLADPFEALRLCRSYLSEGGVVVASIPNIRFFDAMHHIVVKKDFHYAGAGIFDKTHLRFFTKKSIERLFSEAGFTIQTLEGINSMNVINERGYTHFKLLNTLLFRAIADMEFQQFAVVARP